MSALPIDAFLDDIVRAVRDEGVLVLTAEPGAGKTTRVPPALLHAGFAARGAIAVLEPRRLAARLAARRVASDLGEEPGRRVGWQVRHDTVGSDSTRIWFLTEGVLTRRLASDPTLSRFDVVVLDEFHERSLHADLALAWIDALRRGPRPDLRLVVMSATIDAERVAAHLACSSIAVPGRVHPVAIEYALRRDDRPLARRVSSALESHLGADDAGDALVFLPGAGEIRRVMDELAPWARTRQIDVRALHGAMAPGDQDRALAPSTRPRVIVATNVAETSITIDGVRLVVDSGLARQASHSPWTGLPAFDVAAISRASAAQRAGRAGRTAPGRCVRLYSRADHDARPAHETPEILRADLAELALTLAALGVTQVSALRFLDAPPEAARDAARRLLAALGAIDHDGRLTATGRALAAIPAHPRLGRLALEAARRGATTRGARLAALAGERDVLRSSRVRFDDARPQATTLAASDLLVRHDALLDPRRELLDPHAARAVLDAAAAIARALPAPRDDRAGNDDGPLLIATLTAFSDRLARRRAPGSDEFVFASGGSGRLDPACAVRGADLLAVIDARQGERKVATITLASAVSPEWLLELFPERLASIDEVYFDEASGRVRQRLALTFDGLPIEESVRSDPRGPEVARVLAAAIRSRGLGTVVDLDALAQLRARRAFASRFDPIVTPLDDAEIDSALVACCEGQRSFDDVRAADLLSALDLAMPPRARAALARLAPLRVLLPSGRRAPIEYPEGSPPYTASFVQDFFGQGAGPSIADGRVPLVLHLLAPSRRPVQVTSDLSGFWHRHYPSLRRELMRRYPRHAWPENPLRPE